jgi:hypothetical protein
MHPAWNAGDPRLNLHVAAAQLLEANILTTPESSPSLSPERKLWLAVIADALSCLGQSNMDGWNARRWFFSRDFDELCQWLGPPWDCSAIRAHLAQFERRKGLHNARVRFLAQTQPTRVVQPKKKKGRRRTYHGPAAVPVWGKVVA